MKTTSSDSAMAKEWQGNTQQQQPARPTDPTMKIVVSLGSRALEEALVALIFEQSGTLPDLPRAEQCAHALVETGGLLMASLMCIKGSGSLAESREKIKAALSDMMRAELGDRLMEIAARACCGPLQQKDTCGIATNGKHPLAQRP